MLDPMSLTLGSFLRDEWLPAVRAKIRPTTYVGYEGHVRRYLVPGLGDKPLDEITPLRGCRASVN